jgi:hypothetical protein
MSDRSFLRLLGFAESKVLDYSAWEDADYRHDLNTEVPAELFQQFDCVIDSGTLEHIFDVRAALQNIARMLRPGGRAIHLNAPTSNNIDHGFYCFSPTFFQDYYTVNRFDINRLYLMRAAYGRVRNVWDCYEYQPGKLDHFEGGDLGPGHWMTLCVATKKESSTCNAVPQQFAYAKAWQQGRFLDTPPVTAEQRGAAFRLSRWIYRRALGRRPRLRLLHTRRLLMSGRIY